MIRIVVEPNRSLVVFRGYPQDMQDKLVILAPDEPTLDKMISRATHRKTTATRLDMLDRNEQVQQTLKKINVCDNTQ
jgi:hypothetical protein